MSIIEQATVIAAAKDEHLRGLLACGHYSRPIYNRSSQWDFPGEAQVCPTCSVDGPMHDRTIAALREQSA